MCYIKFPLKFQLNFVDCGGLKNVSSILQVCDTYVGDKLVKLQLWDTAGQERYRAITSQFYRGSHAVILMFDLTFKKSFESIRTWLSLVRENCPNDPYIILIGNKSDLKSTVSYECVQVCVFLV